jgi:hypothetical protein
MPGFTQMPVHRLFISCGDEVDTLRDIASNTAMVLLPQLLERLGVQIAVRSWDYRREPGEIVAAGDFAARSLDQVHSSHAAVGIFGEQTPLPPVSVQEMEELYKRRAAGDDVEIALFFKSPVSKYHKDWHQRLQRDSGRDIVYTTYDGEPEFRERILAELIVMFGRTHFQPRSQH